MIALIVLGGIAVIAIVIYIIWYYNRQRTKALKVMAESLNFIFAEKCDKSLMNALGAFHLFSQGYSRRISNVLTGKFNLITITVMDYKYTTGGGKSSLLGIRRCYL